MTRKRIRIGNSLERRPREGGEEAFRVAGSAVDDELLLEVVLDEFEHKEWNW